MNVLTKILYGQLLMALLFVYSGCQPCFYAPSAQNVPLFTEKKQASGNCSFQFGTLSFGWNIQGAVSVSDHIGLMGNYNHYAGNAKTSSWYGDEFNSYFKGNMGEGGLGLFMPLEEKLVIEIYAGAGGSRINTDYDWYSGKGSSSVTTTCYFIQPAIGYYVKNIQLAFSARTRFVDFREITYSGTLVDDAQEYLEQIEDSHVSTFFEPAVTFRAGSENVKFQVQTMVSIPLGDMEVSDYDPLNINFGIVFSIREKKNK